MDNKTITDNEPVTLTHEEIKRMFWGNLYDPYHVMPELRDEPQRVSTPPFQIYVKMPKIEM